MIRWIALASVLIVVVATATFVYQTLLEPVPEPGPAVERGHEPDDGPPPKLEVVGSKAHQFDTLLVGGKGAHTWQFKNVGAGPMEVWLEETTCSCTVATLKSD